MEHGELVQSKASKIKRKNNPERKVRRIHEMYERGFEMKTISLALKPYYKTDQECCRALSELLA